MIANIEKTSEGNETSDDEGLRCESCDWEHQPTLGTNCCGSDSSVPCAGAYPRKGTRQEAWPPVEGRLFAGLPCGRIGDTAFGIREKGDGTKAQNENRKRTVRIKQPVDDKWHEAAWTKTQDAEVKEISS